MQSIKATLRAGHQVASGKSTTDTRFPNGTIRMQLPFFKQKGLNLEDHFDGKLVCATLNLSIAPHSFKIAKPEFFFETVKWTDLQPAENFFMSSAQISFNGIHHKAMIYIPDPSTKPAHFQASDIIEVIAEKIHSIQYGDTVDLLYNPSAITIS